MSVGSRDAGMRAAGTMTPCRAALYATIVAWQAADEDRDGWEETEIPGLSVLLDSGEPVRVSLCDEEITTEEITAEIERLTGLRVRLSNLWGAGEGEDESFCSVHAVTVEDARDALRESDEECAYVLLDCESGVTHVIMAAGDEDAYEAAREWAREGDYDLSNGTLWVDVSVYAEHLGNAATLDKITVQIDPEEPACVAAEHDWQGPHALVGGLRENPGVHGHGGGVIISEACMRCGCGRKTDTWAQRPDTGEQGLTSVSYEPGEYADRLKEEEGEAS